MDVEGTLTQVLGELQKLNARLDELDIDNKLEGVRKEMTKVAADSQIVVHTVHNHGTAIERLTRAIENISLHCPVFEPASKEEGVGNGGDRLRPSSSEYEALRAAVNDDDDQ